MIAKALSVRDQPKSKNGKKRKQTPNSQNPASTAGSRRKTALDDDTPRMFQRLMQYQTTGKRVPSGLETGEKNRGNKKGKRDTGEIPGDNNERSTKTRSKKMEPHGKEAMQDLPKILPGEKLSDFAARVDRALPLLTMTKSNQPGIPKVRDHKMTRHEMHLRRLQKGWREEEAKIREREQAEREERAAEMEDQLELMKQWEIEARGGRARKKGSVPKKKKGSAGVSNGGLANSDDDDDPWAKLKKRDKERQSNPFDFAQAPPQLTKPREIFKVRDGAKVDVANVPNAVGSLRRREELAGEREISWRSTGD